MQAVVQVLFVADEPRGSERHDGHDVLHQPSLLRRLSPPLLLPRIRAQLPLSHQEPGMHAKAIHSFTLATSSANFPSAEAEPGRGWKTKEV